jgi:hypothetical protein
MLTNMRTIKHSRKDCGGNLKSDTVKNDRWHQANGHGKKNEQTKGEVKKKKTKATRTRSNRGVNYLFGNTLHHRRCRNYRTNDG